MKKIGRPATRPEALIRTRMDAVGLSVSGLGAALDLSPAQAYRMASGKAMPSASQAQILRDLLGVGLEEIYLDSLRAKGKL